MTSSTSAGDRVDCTIDTTASAATPHVSADLLPSASEETWNQTFLSPTGLTFQTAMLLKAAIYDQDGDLLPGLTSVRLGHDKQVGVEGDDCAINALRDKVDPVGITIHKLSGTGVAVPLTPNFEPVWRCNSADTMPLTNLAGTDSTLELEWGSDESGTFVDGILTVRNTGSQPVTIPNASAVLLDVHPAESPDLVARYTAWIEPGTTLPELAPGAITNVRLSATSATAGCAPPQPQHLPPGRYTAAIQAAFP
jgi:hypothetical protein